MFDSRWLASYHLSDDGNRDHALRTPERIFSAADGGEKVTIRRGKSGYVLTGKTGQAALYGCLRGAIRHDAGKPRNV